MSVFIYEFLGCSWGPEGFLGGAGSSMYQVARPACILDGLPVCIRSRFCQCFGRVGLCTSPEATMSKVLAGPVNATLAGFSLASFGALFLGGTRNLLVSPPNCRSSAE